MSHKTSVFKEVFFFLSNVFNPAEVEGIAFFPEENPSQG